MNRIIQSRYWNTNGIGIAIVAVRGHADDIAAYIGASIPGAQRQEIAEEDAASTGAKLTHAEALQLLPTLEAQMTALGLSYRR